MNVSATVCYAVEGPDPYADNLLGHWGGLRDTLSDTGVDMTVEYTADILSNVSGGIKRGTSYMDNLDIKFGLDGEKLFGMTGTKASFYFLSNQGGKLNPRQVGSVQGIDNIEVHTNTFKLYEAWLEQNFFDDTFSVLLGLYDLNSEFSVTDMTENFIKPVMQIGQSFAQSGQNGPSLFPTTSLAARITLHPTEQTYVSAAMFDGIPGDPSNGHGTHIHLRERDGLLFISELGYTPGATNAGGAPNKFALGAWTYTKKMDDLIDVNASGKPVKRRMHGVYLLSSYQFYHHEDTGRDLGAFFRAGLADGNTAQIDWDYVTGIVGTGWVPSRPESEIGIGFAQAHNARKYLLQAAGSADHNEYSLELYYRDELYRGIRIQPDLQYVINPGANTATKDAVIVGIRFDINF